MTIGYDMTVSIEYQISSQYSEGISVATTMGIVTNKTKNPSSPAMVPDTVTENSPSFMDTVGDFFSNIGNGLVAVSEGMMNFTTENPALGMLLIIGSLLIPGPQFAFL